MSPLRRPLNLGHPPGATGAEPPLAAPCLLGKFISASARDSRAAAQDHPCWPQAEPQLSFRIAPPPTRSPALFPHPSRWPPASSVFFVALSSAANEAKLGFALIVAAPLSRPQSQTGRRQSTARQIDFSALHCHFRLQWTQVGATRRFGALALALRGEGERECASQIEAKQTSWPGQLDTNWGRQIIGDRSPAAPRGAKVTHESAAQEQSRRSRPPSRRPLCA